ncbi:hypothetical protein D3C87_1854890 [compost metagenome]
MTTHVELRDAHEPGLLAAVDGLGAAAEAIAPPGLHLHEDQRGPVLADEVHLAELAAEVALAQPVAEPGEVVGGQCFTAGAEGFAIVRCHRVPF